MISFLGKVYEDNRCTLMMILKGFTKKRRLLLKAKAGEVWHSLASCSQLKNFNGTTRAMLPS
jgi:hypothetical protein